MKWRNECGVRLIKWLDKQTRLPELTSWSRSESERICEVAEWVRRHAHQVVRQAWRVSDRDNLWWQRQREANTSMSTADRVVGTWMCTEVPSGCGRQIGQLSVIWLSGRPGMTLVEVCVLWGAQHCSHQHLHHLGGLQPSLAGEYAGALAEDVQGEVGPWPGNQRFACLIKKNCVYLDHPCISMYRLYLTVMYLRPIEWINTFYLFTV